MTALTPEKRRLQNLVRLAVALVTMTFAPLVLETRKGLDTGLSFVPALLAALLHVWPMPVVFACTWGACHFYINRGLPKSSNMTEVGRSRWERTRLVSTIVWVPAILIQTGLSVFALVTGRWEAGSWIEVGMAAFFGIALISYWVRKPGQDYLYFLGSGDNSRMNDERVQLIAGKSASTTLCILGMVIYLGGSAYEILALGSFPRLSLGAVAAMLAIYFTSQWYWQRKV